MSIARQLGTRKERRGTLLEYLPIELREEVYYRVYHDCNVSCKLRATGASMLSIGKDSLAISYDTVNGVLLGEFICDIFYGLSSRFSTKYFSPSMAYDSSTDNVIISGTCIDKDGWLCRECLFIVPLSVELVQALFDLRDNLHMR